MRVFKKLLCCFCSIAIIISSTVFVSATNSLNIPTDAYYYNGHYYMVYDYVCNSWESAKTYCENKGGYLATITSQSENDAVYSYVTSLGYENAYFGFSDSNVEGKWEWVTGEEVNYTNWHSGEPNAETSTEDYAMFYWKFSDGTWNDGNFGNGTVLDDMVFICEWDTQNNTEAGILSDGIHIYSDHSNLSIKQGDSLTVGAGLFKDNNQINDVSKMTYMIEDTSIVKANNTSVHDNCLFVKLSSQSVGTTYITFSDSNTGYTLRTPITVYDNSKSSYTISGVPVCYQLLNTNFFNANGLCVDNYTYSVNNDKTANVSFDVYNSKYTYGAVEVYDSNGNIKDVVSINKMKMNNTSIKSSVWDNTCNLVNDFVTGDITNYRSKLETAHTHVSVKIPENGYIVITNDPSESVTVAVVNAVDMLMSLKSVTGSISNFDEKSNDFARKVTKKMVLDTAYKDLYKNQYKYSKNILKGISKNALFSTESLGDFANTILNNLQTIDADKLIKDSAIEFGWSFGESVFKELAGPVGQVMNGLFAFGKLGNLIVQENAFVTSFEAGSIAIQNQGGGVRNASQVTVTSETNFNSETALKVFQVTVNNDFLRLIEQKQPDIYNTITSGVTETYNISMIKNGAEEQPNGIVEVYIPLHDEMSIFAHSGIFKVYRVELDGALTDMNAEYKNGSMVFKTNHFSYYMVVAYNENDNPTDNITEPQTDNLTEPTTDKLTEPVVTQPATNAPTQSATEAPKTTAKKPNPVKVSVKKKNVKLKKLKKKAQKVKAITVKNAQGNVTYKLVAKGITKKIRKLVKISSKGVITIKRWKKAKTGDCKIKVKITAKGNKGYNRKTVTKTVKIRIE